MLETISYNKLITPYRELLGDLHIGAEIHRQQRQRRINGVSNLQQEINKVRPELIRKGFNPASIRTINQLKRIMDNINGRNRFRELIPTEMRDFGVSENGKYILILEVHYEYEFDGERRPEIIHHMPIEILSETFPTTAQIEEAIVERLNSTGRSDYGVSDITNFYVLNNRNPEDLVMRGRGVMDFHKLKSDDYHQREGNCVVDWLYHHVKHSGRIISQKWYEKRFYDFCGKDIDYEYLVCFYKIKS